jgi:hypothetical protein
MPYNLKIRGWMEEEEATVIGGAAGFEASTNVGVGSPKKCAR